MVHACVMSQTKLSSSFLSSLLSLTLKKIISTILFCFKRQDIAQKDPQLPGLSNPHASVSQIPWVIGVHL